MLLIKIEKILWLLTGIYWFVAAFNVKKSFKRQNDLRRIVYMCFWVVAFLLLFTNNISFLFLNQPFYLQQPIFKISGMILCIIGLLFAVWARIYLGKNWSGRIAIKQEHQLIQAGPYALSRNPIYTGVLLAFVGCAMTEGLVKGYLSLLFIIPGIFIKIAKEESYMSQVFADHFIAYKLRVKKILPFIY